MWQAVHRYAENGYVGQQQQSADQMQAGQRAAGRGGAKQKQEISLGHRIGLVKGWGWGKSVQASSWHGRRAAAGLGWSARNEWCALRQRCACCAQQPPACRRLTARPTAAAAPAAAARPLASLWAAPDPGTPALAAPWPCIDWARLGAEQLNKQTAEPAHH